MPSPIRCSNLLRSCNGGIFVVIKKVKIGLAFRVYVDRYFMNQCATALLRLDENPKQYMINPARWPGSVFSFAQGSAQGSQAASLVQGRLLNILVILQLHAPGQRPLLRSSPALTSLHDWIYKPSCTYLYRLIWIYGCIGEIYNAEIGSTQARSEHVVHAIITIEMV